MNDALRRLQLVQLETLKLVDRICQENDICYSLSAGTLLGAVRHKGFIPWDDDLDICMSRKDYNRFLSLWDNVEHDGYTLQNKENSPGFSQSFTKIRKDHTTFIEIESECGRYHNGIFIDIFPVDRIPNGWINRKLFFWWCLCYQLFTREYIPEKSNPVVKAISRFLLALVPPKKRPIIRENLLNKITSQDAKCNLHCVFIETASSVRRLHQSYLMDSFVELPFKDDCFSCFANWDDYLKIEFGEYLKYPPKEDQTWSHHPIILDFERGWNEYERT